MALPSKATHRQTRAHNERLVLRAVYDLGPISRAEVARLTGLTRTTVSDVVSGLLDEGVVREVGRGPSSGGKAPILVQVATTPARSSALDLGETGPSRRARRPARRDPSAVALPLDGRDGDAAVELVYRAARCAPRARAPARSSASASATPGLVDSADRHDPLGGQPRLARPALGSIVSERYGVPTIVANDSQAAALAEYIFGGEKRAPT